MCTNGMVLFSPPSVFVLPREHHVIRAQYVPIELMDATVSRRQSIRGRGLSDSINYAGQGQVRAWNTCWRKKTEIIRKSSSSLLGVCARHTTIAASGEKRYDKLVFLSLINFGGFEYPPPHEMQSIHEFVFKFRIVNPEGQSKSKFHRHIFFP